jgi:RNA recognition motif-containing protein
MPPQPMMMNPVNSQTTSSSSQKKTEDQTTTVYVGKIPSTVEDDFIRKLLEVYSSFKTNIVLRNQATTVNVATQHTQTLSFYPTNHNQVVDC